jgi:ribosomal-protein-serine acetyltransferase
MPVNPILLDVPERIVTPRLCLRVPRAGDGAIVLPAARQSLSELKPWMVWATDDYSLDGAEDWCRRNAGKFIDRTQIAYLVFLANESEHLGNVSAFAFDWEVGKCEIGYWLRTSHTGRGFMTEAVQALIDVMKKAIPARRIEIRMDAKNTKSRRVAERLGFELEGILRANAVNRGRLVDQCVYAWVDARAQSPET